MKYPNESLKYPRFIAHVKAEGITWSVFSKARPGPLGIDLLVDRNTSAPGGENRFNLLWGFKDWRFADNADLEFCRGWFPSLECAVLAACISEFYLGR